IEQLNRIEIRCAPNNIASQGVPKKLGFLCEGTLKNRTTDTEGELRDVMIWTMFKEDYPKEIFSNFNFKAFNIINEQIK
ncbi:MAG: GNAT family protein, partial [Saprospiraceae bacterium]